MKNAVLILGLVFISCGAFAQKRSDFQGPKFKNYKAWQYNVQPTVVLTSNKKTDLSSPEFKNYKIWQAKDNVESVKVNLSVDRPKLIGPKFKNYKPWRNNS